MSFLPKYEVDAAGGAGGNRTPVVGVYTASGAIDPLNDIAVLSASAALALTITNGTQDGHQLLLVRPGESGGAHTITGNFNEVSGRQLATFGSPNGGEALVLEWSTARTTWYTIGQVDPGYKLSDLPALGVALDGAGLLGLFQSSADFKVPVDTVALYTLTKSLPSIQLTGPTTLVSATHNKRRLRCTSSLTLTVPAAGTLGLDFECYPMTIGAAVSVALSGTLIDLAGNAVTSIQPGKRATIFSDGVNNYCDISNTATGTTGAIVNLATIVGQTPTATSTASGTFSNGLPASFTATKDGVSLTIAAITINTTSGSGATAAGTFSFTFTTPATGTYSIIANSTGAYAQQSNSYTLVTASTALLGINSVVPVGAGIVNAVISGTFSNGAPTGVTIVDSANSNAAVANTGFATSGVTGSGATAAGSWSATITNPAAGNHTLVATGTGTYTATSSGYSYTTTAVSMTVNSITAPAPSTAFTVSGTYTNSSWNPSNFQYSTDSTNGSDGTWTTASGATISSGSYSFSIGGLTAGSQKVWVRGITNVQVFAGSNTFTIANVGGTITSPGAISTGSASTISLTVSGSGSPTVYASFTIGGVEQTPRTSVTFGDTSVSLTPTSTGSATASLYAASSGGSALATTASFTISAGTPSYPLLASMTSGTLRPVVYDANNGMQPNSTVGTTLSGLNDALGTSADNLAATAGVTSAATVNGLPSVGFPSTQGGSNNSGLKVVPPGTTWMTTLRNSNTVGSSFAIIMAWKSLTLSTGTEILVDNSRQNNNARMELWWNGASGHNQMALRQNGEGGTIGDTYFGPAPPANNAVHIIAFRYTYNGSASWSVDTWFNGTKSVSPATVAMNTAVAGTSLWTTFVIGATYGITDNVGVKTWKFLELHPLYNPGATISDASMALYVDNTTGYMRTKWGA